MCNLVVHNSREAGSGLLGATVRLNDVDKASGNCGMLAADASTAPAATTMVLVSIFWFGTYQSR